MILNIISIIFILFAICYPLGYVFHFGVPIKQSFDRFNYALISIVASLGVLACFALNIPRNSLITLIAWVILLLCFTWFLWDRDKYKEIVLILMSMIGMLVFGFVSKDIFPTASINLISMAVCILGGWVISLAIYAMNLGHWYLNVKKLDLKHLIRTVYGFTGLVILRLIWDGVMFLTKSFTYRGEMISLGKYLFTLDGVFLWIALLFGSVVPLILTFMTLETLRVKSTQSATGILYVIVVSLMIGELTYKYYLVQFGWVL
ncbi:hypothetical protein IID04_04865 [PVC group bacterium]|nr:hypothetical protein [PVC group bacterium]